MSFQVSNGAFLHTDEVNRQLGLGGAVIPAVSVPAEVPLSRSYPGGTSVKCTDIAAGELFIRSLPLRKLKFSLNNQAEMLPTLQSRVPTR